MALRLRAAYLAVAAAFAWLIGLWVPRRIIGGDTPYLVDGTDALAKCLSRHDLVACGFTGHLSAAGQMSPIGPYPLLQYVPDFLTRSLGATHHSRYAVLALLSALAVVAALLLAWLVLSRLGIPYWIWGFSIVVLSGPLLVYANTTWGEMLAGGVLVFLVAAAVLQAPPPVVAVAAFAACLTKETSYPFVAAIGLLGLVLARRRTGAPIRRHVLIGAGGIALGFVSASLFNVLRFGSIGNTNYLQPEFRTPLSRIPELAVGLFVAPNGGILIFWSAATLLLAAMVVIPFVRRNARFDRKVALALAAIVVGLTLGLASWYSPFGWVAWGPRLSLPWVLPVLLLGLAAFGRPLGALAGRLLEPGWRFLLIGVALVAVTLPQVGYMWRRETVDAFFALSLKNEHCTTPAGPGGSPDYYACLHETMWERRSIINDALSGLGVPGGAFTAVVVAAGLFGCLVLLRDGVRSRGDVAGQVVVEQVDGQGPEAVRLEGVLHERRRLADEPGLRVDDQE